MLKIKFKLNIENDPCNCRVCVRSRIHLNIMNACICIFLDECVSNGEWGRLHDRRRKTYARVVFMKEGTSSPSGEDEEGLAYSSVISEWKSLPSFSDHRRASKLIIGQTARAAVGTSHGLVLESGTNAGVSFAVEIFGRVSDVEGAPEPSEKLLAATPVLHTKALNIKTCESRPSRFDLQGLSVDQDLRRQAPLQSHDGRSRGTLNYSIWIEPNIDFEDESFSTPESLRNAVLSTIDLTLVVVATRAYGLRQPDMFRKPWPFINLEIQMQDPDVLAKTLTQSSAGVSANDKGKDGSQKQKKKRKKQSTRNDPIWPKVSEWESYEIDATCDPEWGDRKEFRLLDLGLPLVAESKTDIVTEENLKTESASGLVDRKKRVLRQDANEESAKVRIDVRVMDRDKDKDSKLATMEAPIPIKLLPIQADPLKNPDVSEDESKSSAPATSKKSRKSGTNASLLGGLKRNENYSSTSSSEREYELFSKGKAAGTLILNMWLRPSEAMFSAGNKVMNLFQVASALLKSPLKDRWTADVCRTNTNKVASILGCLEAAFSDWRFAGMLERLPGGGVSHELLDEAKQGLISLKSLLVERTKLEAHEREAREEGKLLEEAAKRESEQKRVRLMLERAKSGGARARYALQRLGEAGGKFSDLSQLEVGSAHADFVEERVHGVSARAAGRELPPSKFRTFLMQPYCPDRISMMRWSLNDSSVDLLLTWAQLVSYGNILELDLPENYIGAQGASLISQSLCCSNGCLVNLEMLNLRQNNTGDKGCRAIAEALKTHEKIRVLDLSCTGIGKEGSMYLSQMMARCKSLRLLNIEQNHKIGPGEKALLTRGQQSRRTRMSALQLVAVGKKSVGNKDSLKLLV